MKILAQSTVESRPSYMHLGYTAATMIDVGKPLTGVCVGLLLLGALLTTKFRLYRSERSGLCVSASLRRPIPLAIFGFLVATTAVVVYLKAPERLTHSTPSASSVTKDHIEFLQGYVKAMTAKGEPVPTDLRQMQVAWKIDSMFMVDGWLREMVFRVAQEHGHQAYHVVSAGPDGRFDTNDDISVPHEETSDDNGAPTTGSQPAGLLETLMNNPDTRPG
jgi:hypothetical protein